jgi:hypothetical protein
VKDLQIEPRRIKKWKIDCEKIIKLEEEKQALFICHPNFSQAAGVEKGGGEECATICHYI